MNLSVAEQALCKLDPVLGALITRQGPIRHTQSSDYFAELAESIISQQLSVKASDTIFRRFKEQTNLKPQLVRQLTEEQIKQIGLSAQKARYLRDLADHFYRDASVFDHLDSLDDQTVITELTQVKGIGIWTAQMFLMFTLGRPDVFAPDDLGLANAIVKLHELPQRPGRAELLAIAQKWEPYRSTACFHLWRLLDNEPLSQTKT